MRKLLLIAALISFGAFAHAQTVTYQTNSGPSFKSVNFSPSFAGPTWNQNSYNDSTWTHANNGGGLQTGGTCDGPNTCHWCAGDTIIWSSPVCVAPDTSCFRKFFNFGSCGRIISAVFSVNADNKYMIYLNGHFLGANPVDDTGVTYSLDSTELTWLTLGNNLVAASVVHPVPYCAEFDMVGTVTVDTTGCATAGIAQIDPSEIRIYPNPAVGSLTISLTTSTPSYLIALYDVTGSLVLSQHALSPTTTIDINRLAKGNYMLRVTDTKGRISTREITKE